MSVPPVKIDMNKKAPATKLIVKGAKALRVGFVPLNDCAPLVIAQELGLFKKYDLTVELTRELGWATIRDKIIYGELDAAHALAGLPVAATLGLGSAPCECVTGMVLSLNGNAITLSRELWENGVRDVKSLREVILRSRGLRTYTFGVVFPFSSHNFLLRQWLASAGIHPDRDVRIVVVPPPQMFVNLKAGNLDGYCVGEPWNSVAVRDGAGWCVETSARLSPRHPEKVLLVRRRFAEERSAEHLALIAALIEACAYCDEPDNADHVIRTLALRKYLNTSPLSLGDSLRRSFDFGHGRVEAAAEFQIFHRHGANVPSQEKAAWVMQHMLRTGQVSDSSKFQSPVVRRIFLPEVFCQAEQLLTKPTHHEHKSKAESTCLPEPA
jgi:ABC-type nitrate/sulfonate/bicarbonate transport system substrate-binding protein